MYDDKTLDEQALFERLLAMPSPDRSAFLAAERVDPALRERVMRLVAAHEDAEGTACMILETVPAPGSSMPEAVDAYRVLEHIGEGGMGIVYLAEQTEPVRRRVALKILKTGMASADIITRFHAERQALALMNHTNIAQILDGGVHGDRPYFVMEYVPGLPITTYCDRHGLDIDARLRLFVDVCRGVHHAHQKGIIHRDLKPSNVLVMEQGAAYVPKIIDFGIAKAVGLKLTDETMHTEAGRLIGTPEYMSPEQARLSGRDIDTRTDVYALGAILYELLVGERVFQFSKGMTTLVDIQRTILERDPSRPSTRIKQFDDGGAEAAHNRATDPTSLARRVREELDWITLRALEKDRSRRYASVWELADDVERSLCGRPVIARPPSVVYRSRKFVRRHRIAVSAAVVVGIALIAATTISLLFGLSEARQRDVAVDAGEAAVVERDTALAVIDFLTDDLLASVQPDDDPGRGRDVSMRAVLDAASQRIDAAAQPGGRFHDRPLVEARVRDTLAETYRHLAAFDDAQPHAERALELRRAELGDQHEDTLAALFELGMLHRQAGRNVEAEPLMARLLEIRSSAGPADSVALADARAELGNIYAEQGRFDEAEELMRLSLATYETKLGADSTITVAGRANLGSMYFLLDRYEEAEPLLTACLEAETAALGADDPSTLMTKNSLAVLYAETGRTELAGRLMGEVIESCARVYGPDHPNTLSAEVNQARMYYRSGDLENAESIALRSAEHTRAAVGNHHVATVGAWDVLSRVYEARGDEDLALESRRVWLESWIGYVETQGPTPDALNQIAWFLLTADHEPLRDPERSVELARRAVELSDRREPSVLDTLARALHAVGDTASALVEQRAAIALVSDDDPSRGDYEAFLEELEKHDVD